ncbi:hypothetical protein LQ51_16875 [Micromonospora sp. HK10]|nr:hypothetical protein LQ51_16875 [Micromonospora sp. HK10]
MERGVRDLSDADLENPPTMGPERFPMENRILHVNRELIHHGAEISLLRDLYRWQDEPYLAERDLPALGDRASESYVPP